MDFLQKVRAMPEDQFNTQMCDLAQEALKKFGRGPQTLLGKKAQAVGKRSTQDMNAEEMTICDVMKRARLATDTDWWRKKLNYAAEIEAPNQSERLEAIKTNSGKQKGAFKTDVGLQKMVTEALFDGSLREAVALRLGVPREQMVVKPAADVNLVPEFPDGGTAMREMCTMCHSIDRVNKAIKSPQGWRQTVNGRLRGGGVDDPKLVAQITEYLVSRGGSPDNEARTDLKVQKGKGGAK